MLILDICFRVFGTVLAIVAFALTPGLIFSEESWGTTDRVIAFVGYILSVGLFSFFVWIYPWITGYWTRIKGG